MPNPGEEARRKLLAKEREQGLRTIAEFQKVSKRLERELYELLLRIEKERQTEGNASPATLLRKARARDLFEQVNDEIFRLSQRLGLDTSKLQRSAIGIAKTTAGEYAQLTANLTFFDSAATRELIGIAGDGEPLSKHFEGIAEPVRNRMFESLFAGIATGRPNASIAKEIKDAVGFGAARALTIARTETNRAYREASRKYYDDAGEVVGWRWVAALDLTTCPICWSLHGRIFKTSEKFATHPNCRCTMVPVFAGDPPPTTGPDKFAKLTREQQRTILGPRRLDLYEAGAELRNFVERYTSTFGPSRRLRPIASTTFEPNPRTPAEPAFPPRPIGPSPAAGPATPPPALTAANAKPGDPVPTFKNSREANEYLEKRFPGTKFDFGRVDFRDGFGQAQANEIVRLLDLYPGPAARLKYFGTYDDRDKWKGTGTDGRIKGEFGHASLSGNYIAINPDWYGDASKYRNAKKRAKETGWSVTDADQGTVTHEFGHAVDGWIRYDVGRDYLVPFASAADERGTIRDIADKIRKRFKPKVGEQSDYSIKPGRDQKFEQFAEAFSMIYNRPPAEHSRYAKALDKLLRMIDTDRRVPAKDVQFWRDLPTDEEKRNAKIAINDLYKEFGLTPPYKKSEL